MPKLSKHTRVKGIYLLPNLFTTAGLFAAFYAIVSAMRGNFENAAIAIFVAGVADLLDGRIARLTDTQTAFGAEYDSLSDMVAFGVAPALVVYTWALQGLGKIGWLVAFIYTAAGALRLARFNTQVGSQDKRYFQGLSIPTGAAVIVSMVWLCTKYGISGIFVTILAALITTTIAGLMVSNIRYHSFKELKLSSHVPFMAIFVLVLVFVMVSMNPPLVLFAVFTCYAASGPVCMLWRIQKTRKKGKGIKKTSE